MNEQDVRNKLWDLIHDCATATLISQGPDSFPHARTMDCLHTEAEEIWFGSDLKERKISEVTRTPKITLFYSHSEKGWVSVFVIAEVVTSPQLKAKYWKAEWERYWPEGSASLNYGLIRVTPVSADYLLTGEFKRGNHHFGKIAASV
jgi:general stress protein 26